MSNNKKAGANRGARSLRFAPYCFGEILSSISFIRK